MGIERPGSAIATASLNETSAMVPIDDETDLAAAPKRRMFALRFLRHSGAVVAALILIVIGVGAIVAPYLSTDPTLMDLTAASQSPNLHHFMGTDQFGRDIFTRVLYGGRITLTMGLIAMAISAVVGVPLGLIAGYHEKWLDAVIMRVMDMMLAFPGLLLAIAVVAALGQGVTNVMIAVGVSLIPSYVRLVRSSVLSAKQFDYVEPARAMGVPTYRLILKHIVPTVIAPVVVLATVSTGWAIIIGASLNFLGLGVQYPTPEWGSDLNSGRDYLEVAWWLSTFPGLAIMVTILCINMVGDGLREALDPRLRLDR